MEAGNLSDITFMFEGFDDDVSKTMKCSFTRGILRRGLHQKLQVKKHLSASMPGAYAPVVWKCMDVTR